MVRRRQDSPRRHREPSGGPPCLSVSVVNFSEVGMDMKRSERREFLQTAGALVAAGALSPFGGLGAQDDSSPKRKKKAALEEPTGPYAPFRMSIQSYSLRKFGFEKMVE